MAHPPFKTTGLGIPPLPAVPGPGGPSSPGSSSTAWMSGTCGHAPPNQPGVASSLDLSWPGTDSRPLAGLGESPQHEFSS